MADTGATVPLVAPLLDRTGIYSGKPVRGGGAQWGGYALAANHLLGRGGALIPVSLVNATLDQNATTTLRFKVWPRYACRRRLWLSTYRTSAAASNVGIRFTDPSAGTSDLVISPASATPRFTHLHVEDVATPSASEAALSPTWTELNDKVSPILESVACFELPRTDLTLDTNEYGVDVGSCDPGRIVYVATGKGVGAVSTAVQQALTIAQRAGLFQWAVGTNYAKSSTAAAYENVFLADSVPVLLGRKQYATSTVKKLQVRAYCRAGAATVGKVRFTMTSGASVVLDITSGMSAAWLSGDLDVDCEDLSVSDGRRSARYDKCTIEFYRVSGANPIYVESISIGNG